MKNYRLAVEARRDLDHIARGLRSRGTHVQRIIRKSLDKLFDEIGEYPGAGHHREEWVDKRYKIQNVHSYLVFYLWDSSPVRIVAIIHGARDVPEVLKGRKL